MSTGNIQRVRYYKGLMLTAQDFQDEQAYHIAKLQRHILRFPYGIVDGLTVGYAKGKFAVSRGSAVDKDGNEIIVPEGGVEVDPPVEFARLQKAGESEKGLYLSIAYQEQSGCVEQSICASNAKNNRTIESAKVSWEETPNADGKLALAWVVQTESGYDIFPGKDSAGNSNPNVDLYSRRIRIDAGIITENKVTFDPNEGHDHTGKEKGKNIPTDGLADGAVTTAKIESRDDAKKIQTSNIAHGAVDTNQIATGAVTTSQIASTDNAKRIQSANIANEAVTTAQIASTDNAKRIQTVNIANGAVTAAQIESTDDAKKIQTGNIAEGAVGTSKIADGAISSYKLGLRKIPGPTGTIGAGVSVTYSFPEPENTEKPAFAQVVPLGKGIRLSFELGVVRRNQGTFHCLTITNRGAQATGFKTAIMIVD